MPVSAAALPVSADDQAVLRRWANARPNVVKAAPRDV
jgi:hypothetical protein